MLAALLVGAGVVAVVDGLSNIVWLCSCNREALLPIGNRHGFVFLVMEAWLIVGGLGKVGDWSVPVGKDSSELAAALVRLKIQLLGS